MNEKFGERLDTALRESGLTKYRLAQLTGLSQAHVGNLVMGKRAPTDEVLSKIAPVLGLSVAEMKAWAILDEVKTDEVREELRKQLQPLSGSQDAHDRSNRPSLKTLDGGKLKHPPTPEEEAFIEQAEAQGIWHSEFYDPSFWDDPPEEREASFNYLRSMMEKFARRSQAQG